MYLKAFEQPRDQKNQKFSTDFIKDKWTEFFSLLYYCERVVDYRNIFLIYWN